MKKYLAFVLTALSLLSTAPAFANVSGCPGAHLLNPTSEDSTLEAFFSNLDFGNYYIDVVIHDPILISGGTRIWNSSHSLIKDVQYVEMKTISELPRRIKKIRLKSHMVVYGDAIAMDFNANSTQIGYVGLETKILFSNDVTLLCTPKPIQDVR